MDKARRQELAVLKMKKRIKNMRLENKEGNLYAFKSHGKPCSCWACRDRKYRDFDRAKNKRINLP